MRWCHEEKMFLGSNEAMNRRLILAVQICDWMDWVLLSSFAFRVCVMGML